MSGTIHEVQAVFGSDAALQDGMAKLQLAGFHRSEISLPVANPKASEATPEQGAADPITNEDEAQMRTMHAGMAGTVGALAAAGVTIATGGAAAVAIVAAAAVGAATGGLAHTAAHTVDNARHEARDEQADAGELVLSVVAKDEASQQAAIEALRQAGATRVLPVTRTGGQILAT